jgi:cation transport ATPase
MTLLYVSDYPRNGKGERRALCSAMWYILSLVVPGTAVSGAAAVDRHMLTGESLPIQKHEGERVYAATVVREGKLYLRAEHVGADTQAAQIVRLVQEAPARDTRMQNYAEQWPEIVRVIAYSVSSPPMSSWLWLRRPSNG